MSDSDHEYDSKNVNESNFKKIHEKAAKVGYADGIAAGEESVFQQSFDKGYADGLRTGFELEKFRTFCTTISNMKNNLPDNLLQEVKAYELMNIPETTKSDHFQYNEHKEKTLSDISKHQKEYLAKCLQEFQEKLPQTSNLLSLKN